METIIGGKIEVGGYKQYRKILSLLMSFKQKKFTYVHWSDNRIVDLITNNGVNDASKQGEINVVILPHRCPWSKWMYWHHCRYCCYWSPSDQGKNNHVKYNNYCSKNPREIRPSSTGLELHIHDSMVIVIHLTLSSSNLSCQYESNQIKKSLM